MKYLIVNNFGIYPEGDCSCCMPFLIIEANTKEEAENYYKQFGENPDVIATLSENNSIIDYNNINYSKNEIIETINNSRCKFINSIENKYG